LLYFTTKEDYHDLDIAISSNSKIELQLLNQSITCDELFGVENNVLLFNQVNTRKE